MAEDVDLWRIGVEARGFCSLACKSHRGWRRLEPTTLLEHHRTRGEKVMLRVPTIPDARRQPRFKIEVDIRINSRKSGVLQGYTVDISESGIAAMLRLEA